MISVGAIETVKYFKYFKLYEFWLGWKFSSRSGLACKISVANGSNADRQPGEEKFQI